jgi:hypothetical protein
MTKSTTPRRPNHAPIDLDVIQAKCTDDAGCWIWNGAIHAGMPVIRHDRKVVNVRRYIAEHIQGHQVTGRLATASCGNGKCCAPDHIDLITRLALQRRTTRQTQHQQLATRNEKLAQAARARSPLNQEIVDAIRASDLPIRALAAQYNLAQASVHRVKTYQSWKDYRSPFAGLGK